MRNAGCFGRCTWNQKRVFSTLEKLIYSSKLKDGRLGFFSFSDFCERFVWLSYIYYGLTTKLPFTVRPKQAWTYVSFSWSFIYSESCQFALKNVFCTPKSLRNMWPYIGGDFMRSVTPVRNKLFAYMGRKEEKRAQVFFLFLQCSSCFSRISWAINIQASNPMMALSMHWCAFMG